VAEPPLYDLMLTSAVGDGRTVETIVRSSASSPTRARRKEPGPRA